MSKGMGPINPAGKGFPARGVKHFLSKVKITGRIPAGELKALLIRRRGSIKGLLGDLERFEGAIEISVKDVSKNELIKALAWLEKNPKHGSLTGSKFENVSALFNWHRLHEGRKKIMYINFSRVNNTVQMFFALKEKPDPQFQGEHYRYSYAFQLPVLKPQV
ncbi:hypothetical protein ACFLZ2_05580 [Candidatus Margulisiibacteriota bacterium]